MALALSPGIGLMLYRIGAPPWGAFEMNNMIWGAAARHYLEHGFLATRLGSPTNVGPSTLEALKPYMHHPPALSVLLALAIRCLGDSQVTLRLVPLLFTLLGSVIFFLLVREILGSGWAALATGIAGLAPMQTYFGKMPDHEALTLPFLLLAMLGMLRWRSGQGGGWLAAVAVILGGQCGWPIHLVPPVLLVHHLLRPPRQGRGGRLPYVLIGCSLAGGLLFLLHSRWVFGPDFLEAGGLWEAFIRRTRSTQEGYWRFDHGQLLRAVGGRLLRYYTVPALLLAAIGLLDRRRGMVLLLLSPGLLFVLIFREGTYIHDYYLYYLTPGIALGVGLGVRLLWLGSRRGGRCRRGLGLVAVFLLLGLLGLRSLAEGKRLANDEGHRSFHQLGQQLRRHTPPGAVIASPDTVFYRTAAEARRQVVDWINPEREWCAAELEALAGKIDYLVVPRDAKLSSSLERLLRTRSVQRMGRYNLFELARPPEPQEAPLTWEIRPALAPPILDGRMVEGISAVFEPPIQVQDIRMDTGLLAPDSPERGECVAVLVLCDPTGRETRRPLRYGQETDIWDRESPGRRLGPPLAAVGRTWRQSLWDQGFLEGLAYFPAHSYRAGWPVGGEISEIRLEPSPSLPSGVSLAVVECVLTVPAGGDEKSR